MPIGIAAETVTARDEAMDEAENRNPDPRAQLHFNERSRVHTTGTQEGMIVEDRRDYVRIDEEHIEVPSGRKGEFDAVSQEGDLGELLDELVDNLGIRDLPQADDEAAERICKSIYEKTGKWPSELILEDRYGKR